MGYDEIKYYTINEKEEKELIKKLKALLLDSKVILAYLFGSITRRKIIRDIDIIIYTAPPLHFQEVLQLGNKIELVLKIPGDLVQLQDIDPAFKFNVLRNGIPIIINRQLHHRLISQAFSEELDFKFAKRLAQTASP